jgi:aldose 1-epimerase
VLSVALTRSRPSQSRPLSGTQFELTNGEFTATVVEVGAGLRRFAFRGIDVTAPFGEHELPPKGCGAVLVPWPNRLRGGEYSFDGRAYQLPLTEPTLRNAIHGLARWVRWTPLAVDPSSVTMGVDLVPQTGWVFDVRVEVTYALRADAGLVVSVRAVNNGSGPAPFGAGFHPYLSLHGHVLDDATLRLPARQRLLLDDAQVPVGMRTVAGGPHDFIRPKRLGGVRLDDAFTDLVVEDGHSSADVLTPSGSAQVWFDSAFGYLQAFTVANLEGGHAAVAIEPMTCPADAFNSGDGLIVLEPGVAWNATWGIRPLIN